MKVFIKDVSVPVTIFNEQIKYLVPEDEKITPNESVSWVTICLSYLFSKHIQLQSIFRSKINLCMILMVLGLICFIFQHLLLIYVIVNFDLILYDQLCFQSITLIWSMKNPHKLEERFIVYFNSFLSFWDIKLFELFSSSICGIGENSRRKNIIFMISSKVKGWYSKCIIWTSSKVK